MAPRGRDETKPNDKLFQRQSFLNRLPLFRHKAGIAVGRTKLQGLTPGACDRLMNRYANHRPILPPGVLQEILRCWRGPRDAVCHEGS